MTLVGAAVYQYLIRPIAVRQLLMIIQLTLGISLVLQNVLMIFGGQPTRTPSMIRSKLFIIGDIVVRGSHLVACIVSFALAILLYFMLRATDIGRSIRAVQQEPRAASLMGVDVGRVQVMTFAIGIGLLAIAAALLVPGLPLPSPIRACG